MTHDLVPIDPVKDSMEHLMVIIFGKSSSPAYPLAVSVARGALNYDETAIDKQIAHRALLSKDRHGANMALMLLKYLQTLKTLQIFCKGRLVEDYYRISHVLRCYLAACDCNDYKAHCHQVIDDPLQESEKHRFPTIQISLAPSKPQDPITIKQYIFPCTHIQGYFRVQHGHPAKIEDQIQSVAVKNQCDWCPLFDPYAFKYIHTKIVMSNGSVIYQ